MQELLEVVKAHWGIISTFVAILIGGFWLKLDSRYAKKSDLHEVKQQLNNTINSNEHRVTLLESKVDNLPTAQDVAQLQILMTEIKGETQATNARMQAIGHQVSLLLEAKVLNKE